MGMWLALGALAVVLFAWWRTRVDLIALADRAARSGDASAVLAALRTAPTADRVTDYHRVIRRLWSGYHREVAVAVAMDFAQQARTAPVAQFWLREFLQNEPEIAEKHLSAAFLAEFYNPTVAAKCGSHG